MERVGLLRSVTIEAVEQGACMNCERLVVEFRGMWMCGRAREEKN